MKEMNTQASEVFTRLVCYLLHNTARKEALKNPDKQTAKKTTIPYHSQDIQKCNVKNHYLQL